MEIKVVELKDIIPYYDNPRNNAMAVTPVMESVKRYGFIKPIIVDMSGVIIAGHTRYIAAFQLGLKEVPVVYSDMSEENAKMFRIADNKLAEKSEFNEAMLIEELKSLNVPQDMQAFFFENVDSMINFSYETVTSSADDTVFEDVVSTGGYSSGFEAPSSPTSSAYTPSDGSDYDDQEEEKFEDEVEDTGNLDDLYVVKIVDGKKMMKVICPFCGNVEVVEVTDNE